MPPRRPGKIFVLALVPPEQGTVLRTPAEHVVQTLRPGNSVTRYGREWIVGGTTLSGDTLTGRIGFRGAEGVAEVWNDDAQDFHAIAVPAGVTAPFAVDLGRLRMAVQTRGSDIKLASLIDAFGALLSEPNQRWVLKSPQREMSFAEWRRNVSKVTSVRFRVRKPNPHYQDTPNLEALLEQAEATLVTLQMTSDDGLDTDSTFIAESQSHIERGYGEAVYHGVSDHGESIYNTAYRAEEVAQEADVNDDGEVSQDSLTEALSQEDTSGETGDDGARN